MGAPTVHAMHAFRCVVEAKSYKGAAQNMGLSGSAVSKLVTQLEADLGAQLMNRNTRSLTLSDAGARFYAAAVHILDEIEQAAAQARGDAATPSGVLKVSVPTSFALMRLARGVPDFLVRYPDVQLQMNLDDRYVDLVEGGYDCALRIATQMPDSSLVARRLGTAQRVLVAAPRYLKNSPPLVRPEDLLQHNCMAQSASSAPAVWSFRGAGGDDVTVEVIGSLRVNNSVMLRESLLAGVGLSLTPRFVVADLIASKALTVLLPACTPAALTVYGVTARLRFLPQKVKVFMDFVEAACHD
jgi:DNA-binding transcriptional LysR family regulator